MDERRHEHDSVELQQTAERVRRERPALTPLELDRIKLQAKAQASRQRPTFLSTKKGRLMKSRMALTMMIAVGLLMSGSGAGLAVSGISSDGSSGAAQYDMNPPGAILGSEEATSSQARDRAGGAADRQAGAKEEEDGGVQASRQIGAQDDDELPFTGLAAIPLLVLGAVLLVTGTVMRRRLPDSA